MLREWASEAERQRALEEYRREPDVWVKLLTEISAAMAARDPDRMLRLAVGEAIDRHWSGRMVDLVSMGGQALHSWRISASMLIGDCLENELGNYWDSGVADLDAVLRQITPWPHQAPAPDIFGVQCAPELKTPDRLLMGSREGCFCIASIGGEPGRELVGLADSTGGFVMPVRSAEEADAFGAAFCERFRQIAAAKPAETD